MKDFEELKLSIVSEGNRLAPGFLELVLNKGLHLIPDVIQSGAKSRQSLKAHIQNVVCFSYQLGQITGLSDMHMMNLTAAALVHDLNKFPEYEGKPYSTIATEENIKKLLKKLTDDAEEEYELTCEMIVEIIRAHSVFSHVDGAALFATDKSDSVKKLKYLLKAADTLDMSHLFHERDAKDKALRLLNGVVEIIQYEYTWHYFSDNRGIFTNLVHNTVIGLYQENGAIPLLYYPEGVWYLTPKGKSIFISNEEVTEKFQDKLKSIRLEDPLKLLKNAKGVGAKFATNPFELGIPPARIIGLLMDFISQEGTKKFTDKFEKLDKESPAKRLKEYESWLTSAKILKKYEEKRRSLQKRLEKEGLEFEKVVEQGQVPSGINGKKRSAINKVLSEYLLTVQDCEMQNKYRLSPLWENIPKELFSSDMRALHLGYLAGSFAYLLTNHFEFDSDQAWDDAAKVSGLSSDQCFHLKFFDPQSDRGYRIGALLYENGIEIDQVKEKYVQFLEKNLGAGSKTELDQEIHEYISTNLIHPQSGFRVTSRNLKEYIRHNHSQCCHCGNGKGESWMADKVPKQGIKTQFFSNRLKGGGGEPKRNVCRICEESFMSEKLACELYDNHYYLHLFSDGGEFTSHAEPGIFLKGLKDGIDYLRRTDTRSLFIQPGKIMQNSIIGEPILLQGVLTKKWGILVPKFPETIGGQITISVNPPTGEKTNQSTQFLFNLSHLLFLTRTFNLRGILSKSSVPPLTARDFKKIFIDHVPLSFMALIPANDMDATGYNKLWEKLLSLYALRSSYNSWEDDDIVKLARTLFDETGLSLLHFLKTQYTKNFRSDKKPWSEAWPHLKLFIREDLLMPVKKLAEIAINNHFHGGSWSEASQAKPLDLAFDGLSGHRDPETLEDLKMVILHDVCRGLERISIYKSLGKARQEAAAQFVDVFFDELFSTRYNAERARIMRDQKRIRAAFLGYLTILRDMKKNNEDMKGE
jgi:CRISPR-associated protein Csc3